MVVGASLKEVDKLRKLEAEKNQQTRQMESLGLKGVGTKTLYNLCEAVSVHLEPVTEAIRKDILSSNLCVHMDEMPWPIQGEDDDGYMWTMANQAGSLYQFEPTRSGKVADEMLGDYEGPLLSDAYNGYDRFKKKKGKVELDPTTFIRQAIVRNNRKEPQVSPLQYARELRKSPA